MFWKRHLKIRFAKSSNEHCYRLRGVSCSWIQLIVNLLGLPNLLRKPNRQWSINHTIRQLLNSLSRFTVIFVHDLKRKRRRKVFRQLKLCHIVALCSIKTLKISPLLLSHLIFFLSTHSHFLTYLQHSSKIWARCHQVKMTDWFSSIWITSPKNQIHSKL